MRERVLAQQSEPPASAGGAAGAPFAGNAPPADAGGSDKTAASGKKFWRSLEELADAPEFREFVEREYPQHAEEWNDPVERRTFLKLMGASLALAGLSGCVFQPPEKIVPNVSQPEHDVPGQARSSSRPLRRWAESQRRSSRVATKAALRSWKEIRIIPTAAATAIRTIAAPAPPTFFRRRQS